MEKLQRILEWLFIAEEEQINALHEVLVKENLFFLDNVVGKDVYWDFIEQIRKA